MTDEYHFIPQLPDYKINNNGTIINRSGMKLSPFVTKNGYMKININHKGYYVHRLVAQTFIENDIGLPQVNHKDGNKMNNNVSNLEWCSNSDNRKHFIERTGAKPTGFPRPVIEVTTGKKFDSISKASKYFGVNKNTISKGLNNNHIVGDGLKFISAG